MLLHVGVTGVLTLQYSSNNLICRFVLAEPAVGLVFGRYDGHDGVCCTPLIAAFFFLFFSLTSMRFVFLFCFFSFLFTYQAWSHTTSFLLCPSVLLSVQLTHTFTHTHTHTLSLSLSLSVSLCLSAHPSFSLYCSGAHHCDVGRAPCVQVHPTRRRCHRARSAGRCVLQPISLF